LQELNYRTSRQTFLNWGAEPVEWRITSTPTLRQTKGIEIGSPKTKTLINGSGRFRLIECTLDSRRVIDYKTMATHEKMHPWGWQHIPLNSSARSAWMIQREIRRLRNFIKVIPQTASSSDLYYSFCIFHQRRVIVLEMGIRRELLTVTFFSYFYFERVFSFLCQMGIRVRKWNKMETVPWHCCILLLKCFHHLNNSGFINDWSNPRWSIES
jgi:hypothetical protein